MADPEYLEDDAAYRTDVYQQRFEFYESDGTTPRNLVGASFTATIHSASLGDNSEAYRFDVNTVDLLHGVVLVSLTEEQTANFPEPSAICKLKEGSIFNRTLFQWRVNFSDKD